MSWREFHGGSGRFGDWGRVEVDLLCPEALRLGFDIGWNDTRGVQVAYDGVVL